MTNSRILISGAGIGGLALAQQLRHHGFAVTVVERFPGIRPGGQPVDIRGAALTVAERMGIAAAARNRAAGMLGMTVIDAEGQELMSSETETFSAGDIAGDDIEIFRDDLMSVLHSSLDDEVEFRFGDSIESITDTGSAVQIRFDSGQTDEFDLVVGADGLHSNTRRLVFGEESTFIRPLHSHVGIFSIPNYLKLDRWQLVQHLGEVTTVVFSTRDSEVARVITGFKQVDLEYDPRDTEGCKDLLTKNLAGLGWEIPTLLQHMRQAPDFYFDSMAQIHMNSWTSGRVALVGDAGYCGSPLTGQGTSLAMVGAYVLAGELAAAGGDHRIAFGNYENELHEYVQANQQIALKRNPDNSPIPELMAAAVNGIRLKEYPRVSVARKVTDKYAPNHD